MIKYYFRTSGTRWRGRRWRPGGPRSPGPPTPKSAIRLRPPGRPGPGSEEVVVVDGGGGEGFGLGGWAVEEAVAVAGWG